MSLSDDGVEIKIRRKDLLFAKFRAFRPSADRYLIEAANKGGEEMVQLAKQFVPKDSGDLADTIHVEPLSGRPGVRVVAGGMSRDKAYYGRWVEFGRSGGSDGKGATKAEPFFFPAYRLLKKKIMARMGRALSKAAKEVSAKGGMGE